MIFGRELVERMKEEVIFSLAELIICNLESQNIEIFGLNYFWSERQYAGYYKLINLLMITVGRKLGILDLVSPADAIDSYFLTAFEQDRNTKLCDLFMSYTFRSPYWKLNDTLEEMCIYGFPEDVEIPEIHDWMDFVNGKIPLTADENNNKNTCCQIFLEQLEEWVGFNAFSYLELDNQFAEYVYKVVESQQDEMSCYGFNALCNLALREYLDFAEKNSSLIKEVFSREDSILQQILKFFIEFNLISSPDDMYASGLQINKTAVVLYWITGYTGPYEYLFSNCTMCWFIPYFLMATDAVIEKANRMFHCIKTKPKEACTFISGMPVICLK